MNRTHVAGAATAPGGPRALATVLAAVIATAAAPAATFTGLMVFGDSLSDVGNVHLVTSGSLPGSAYWNGRFSNGPIWIEQLATNHLGLPAPVPSMTGGRDFAWGGAYAGLGGLTPTLTQQASGFVATGGRFGPDDLITFWGGANDFLLGGQTDAAVPVGYLSTALTTLAGAGARRILVPNLPDFGDAPDLTSQGPAAVAAMHARIVDFNALLASQLIVLEGSLGIDLVPLDVYSIGKELAANPGPFGFTNTTESALLTGHIADANEYLYWDSAHPTSAVHTIIAQRAALALGIPEPHGILLVATGAWVWVSRRRRTSGRSSR